MSLLNLNDIFSSGWGFAVVVTGIFFHLAYKVVSSSKSAFSWIGVPFLSYHPIKVYPLYVGSLGRVSGTPLLIVIGLTALPPLESNVIVIDSTFPL